MRLIIQNNYSDCSKWAANYVAYKIKAFRPTAKKPFVLGLATGSSPLGMYEELIRMHKNGLLSFANVVTFNIDEYIGLGPDDAQSYHNYMYQNFFNHINIPKANIHLLNGLTKDYVKECQSTCIVFVLPYSFSIGIICRVKYTHFQHTLEEKL